jgi:hypothetical protein
MFQQFILLLSLDIIFPFYLIVALRLSFLLPLHILVLCMLFHFVLQFLLHCVWTFYCPYVILDLDDFDICVGPHSSNFVVHPSQEIIYFIPTSNVI